MRELEIYQGNLNNEENKNFVRLGIIFFSMNFST